MLKDWLFGKMQDHALGASTREIKKFVTALKNMGDKDLGTIVAVATVLRINFEEHGVLPENVFGDGALPSEETLGRCQLEINRLSKQFRKMGLASDAAAAMVWSYTLRCLNVPALRPFGLEIWQELRRGFPYVKDALAAGEKEKNEELPKRVWAEWKKIPTGFETGG